MAFYFFLARTRMGKAIRSSAQDPTTAGLMGVNIHSVLAVCFGLGSGHGRHRRQPAQHRLPDLDQHGT